MYNSNKGAVFSLVYFTYSKRVNLSYYIVFTETMFFFYLEYNFVYKKKKNVFKSYTKSHSYVKSCIVTTFDFSIN